MRDNAGMKPAFLRSWTLKIILLVFALNTAGSFLYWYSIFPWFDNFMHFLGGFWVAVAAYALFYKMISGQGNKWMKFLFIILWVLFIGLLWEVYEFGVQDLIKATGIASIPDSISDLVFDTLGGIAAFLFISKKLKSHE